jgi:hypothetical protein
MPAKERFCAYCGESLGVYADYDRYDTCGARECERNVRDEIREDRMDAHERLDQEMGWA